MNFIKKIFSKSKTETHNDLGNIVLFTCNKSQEPLLEIKISDTSKEASYTLANTLFHLNNGLYLSSILNLLISMSNKDRNIHAFIVDTIYEWQKLIASTQNNLLNNPIINPTDFYKQAHTHNE